MIFVVNKRMYITKTSNFNECAAVIMGWLSESEKRERGMVVFSEW